MRAKQLLFLECEKDKENLHNIPFRIRYADRDGYESSSSVICHFIDSWMLLFCSSYLFFCLSIRPCINVGITHVCISVGWVKKIILYAFASHARFYSNFNLHVCLFFQHLVHKSSCFCRLKQVRKLYESQSHHITSQPICLVENWFILWVHRTWTVLLWKIGICISQTNKQTSEQ